MRTRTLGRTGLAVSEIGFGAWGIGGRTAGHTSYGDTDDRVSLEALRAALDAGINFFDTSSAYGNGHSEALIGEAFAGCRDRVVMATKAGYVSWDQPPDFSPQAVVASYSGDPAHPGSTSDAVGWTVVPDATTASVSVSPTAVTYGYEQLVVVTVTVTTGHGEDLPIGGEVLNVQIGSLDLSARLSLGGGGASGACYLQYRDLTANPIPYAVTTTYAGDIDLLPSATATAPVGLTVNAPPSVTTATLPAGHRNQAYSTTLAASDGTAPLTWSLASGALPTGLALTASTGRISGTVGATATSKTLTFRVTDASGASATRTLTLTIS